MIPKFKKIHYFRLVETNLLIYNTMKFVQYSPSDSLAIHLNIFRLKTNWKLDSHSFVELVDTNPMIYM